MVRSQQSYQFDFTGNVSSLQDPFGLLNFRWLDIDNSTVDRVIYFSSVRSVDKSISPVNSIDTIGGAFASQTLPMAFLAFWNYNSTWPANPFELLTGMSRLILFI